MIELLCTDYNKKATSIHYYFGNAVLGYGTSFAADIIREAKKLMISKGHTYYQSRKLDRVPREAVEELLGITFTDKSN